MIKAVLCIVQAFLFFISSWYGIDTDTQRKLVDSAIRRTAVSDFQFDKISAEEIAVSDTEKELCREWFDQNIVRAGQNGNAPAYDITVGGRKLSSNLDKWTFEPGEESKIGEIYKGGKTTYITVSSKKNGIVLNVEATIYEEYATCEWTVYAKNTAEKNSPVVKNFCGAKMKLNAPSPTLYVGKGSTAQSTDFELLKTDVNPFKMNFSANGGRNSSFLPFFNICGNDVGYVLGVGWTGQWLTTIQRKGKNVELVAKQQELKAYLLPQEEIRTPLVSVSFYKGGNALKGFNTFRNWEMGCVYPETAKPCNGYSLVDEFSTDTAEDLINHINSIDPEVLEDIEYFWMDAGWYKREETWYEGVGNWVADTERFPDTLKPVSDAMAAKGKKFLLWYEPERVRKDSILYNEAKNHSGWLIDEGDDNLWNFANDEACEFITKYICNSMIENGVTIYRQDFNFNPLERWRRADKELYDRRKGICENHYVTNLYKYLDTILETIDGSFIDNCASGGRRLDLEMTRRSVPLWRSDFNCGTSDGTVDERLFEGAQSMTYSLSFWQPYSGTKAYFNSEYNARSTILTHPSVYRPTYNGFAEYKSISQYLTKNYYPIVYGGADTTKYHAMQFGDEKEGAAMIYKRSNVENDSFTLTFNGLSSRKIYCVSNFDDPTEEYFMSGNDLMEKGISITVSETPKVAIYVYSEKA